MSCLGEEFEVMIYLISDPHFGHKNIIQYESRPFKDLYDMDSTLIKNWNSTVSKKDVVYCLGDFSFYNKEKTSEIVSRLSGTKHLVMGNHDESHSVKWWKDVGFDFVYDCSICIKEYIWLSHKPMYMNVNMPYFNIHGDIHSMCMEDREHYLNVSVEQINYTPISLDSIVSGLSVKDGDRNVDVPNPEKIRTQYFTGDAVCIDNNGGVEEYFTVGKIYHFELGTLIDDDGNIWGDGNEELSPLITSIEHWNSIHVAQFCEIIK